MMVDYVRTLSTNTRTHSARGQLRHGLLSAKVYLEPRVFAELKARAIANNLTISGQLRLDILEGNRCPPQPAATHSSTATKPLIKP